jgi:hypothetical protein
MNAVQSSLNWSEMPEIITWLLGLPFYQPIVASSCNRPRACQPAPERSFYTENALREFQASCVAGYPDLGILIGKRRTPLRGAVEHGIPIGWRNRKK